MQLMVNGSPLEAQAGITVLQLLESLKLKSERVAVELNAEVVKRANHGSTVLRAGDALEIVTFVGGG